MTPEERWVARLRWRPRKIVVDNSLYLWERIRLGKYGRVDADINEEKFPLIIPQERGGKEETEITFLFLNDSEYPGRSATEPVAEEDALGLISKSGGLAIGLEELLAIGEQYPKLQTWRPIVALAAAIKIEFEDYEISAVPYLYQFGRVRELALQRFFGQHKWPLDSCFPTILSPAIQNAQKALPGPPAQSVDASQKSQTGGLTP